MKANNVGQIILISIGITVFALLFYWVLGDGVAFSTTGLYTWIGNLIGLGLLLAQVFIHFYILLFISLAGAKIISTPEKKKQISWIYVGFAVIANITIILAATTESRAVMSSEHKWENSEKYEWKWGVTTPEGYPVKMIVGYFNLASKSKDAPFQSFGWGVFHGRWGDGFSASTEYGKSVIPDSLNVTWYSMVENKFYHLGTALDKEKISQLLLEKFQIKRKDGLETWNRTSITAGLAPGGTVVVWVNGMIGESTELAAFKAKEIPSSKIDSHSLQSCRDEVSEAKKDTANVWTKNLDDKNSQIPFEKWKTKYRKKYNWKFLCESQIQLDSAMVDVTLFNGEAYHITSNDLCEDKFEMKALPDRISIGYFNSKGDSEYLSADFNEQDIYRKFELLDKFTGNEQITIICKIDKTGSIASVVLKSQHESLNLEIKTDW